MNWFYANAGQQVGPIEDDEFARLTREGIIQPATLVWREGMANWEPLAKVRPAPVPPPVALGGAAAPPIASPEPRCSNCGGIFPADDLMLIEGVMVCPNCKPIVLQRIKEGVGALRSPVDPDELVRHILDSGRTIDVGRCVGRAWQAMKANFGAMIGVPLLVMFVMAAGGVLPFIGSCISLLISGPLMGGLYIYLLKQIRGQGGTIGDAFSGFSNNFGQLLLGYVVPALLAYLPLIPFGIVLFMHNLKSAGPGPAFGAMDIVLLVIGLPVTIYLALVWMFCLPLIVDKHLNFWKAMSVSRRVTNHHFGPVLLLMLTCIGIGLAGMLALCVGLVVAIPLTFTICICAYDDLFGAAEAQAAIPTAAHG